MTGADLNNSMTEVNFEEADKAHFTSCKGIPSDLGCYPTAEIKSLSFLGELVIEFDHLIEQPAGLLQWEGHSELSNESPLALFIIGDSD